MATFLSSVSFYGGLVDACSLLLRLGRRCFCVWRADGIGSRMAVFLPALERCVVMLTILSEGTALWYAYTASGSEDGV